MFCHGPVNIAGSFCLPPPLPLPGLGVTKVTWRDFPQREQQLLQVGCSREHPASAAGVGSVTGAVSPSSRSLWLCLSPHSHPALPEVSLVSFYFRFFWVRIILILFCLHNPDCYHPPITHIFLQTANGRDKTAAGLCDFCLSNYCNYLKNGLKLYGVMNLIMSLQRCLVLHAACKWASLWEALHKAAAGGIAARSSQREAPARRDKACFAGHLDKLFSSLNWSAHLVPF